MLMTQLNPPHWKDSLSGQNQSARDFSEVTQKLPSLIKKSPGMPQIPMRKAVAILMVVITTNQC